MTADDYINIAGLTLLLALGAWMVVVVIALALDIQERYETKSKKGGGS
jgi:hypothetical protein